jgi:hypothetical protein
MSVMKIISAYISYFVMNPVQHERLMQVFWNNDSVASKHTLMAELARGPFRLDMCAGA